jgi:hypothetical protein
MWYFLDEIREDEMSMACSTHGRNAYRISQKT